MLVGPPSIFLQIYMKWQSGSSKTKSGRSMPSSDRGMGSKHDFMEDTADRPSNPGLAVETKPNLNYIHLNSKDLIAEQRGSKAIKVQEIIMQIRSRHIMNRKQHSSK